MKSRVSLICGLLTLMVYAARADIRTWTGLAGDGLASTAGNWADDTPPASGDEVAFDGSSQSNCTWDLETVPGGWNQAAAYTGRVTFLTRYPGQGTFTNLTIQGNAVLNGGVWTHPANTGTNVAADRLSVTITGDFLMGTGAQINVDSRGFAQGRGPGAGVSGSTTAGRSASHGGLGAYNPTQAVTYGSASAPITLGSGGDSAGGGAVKLTVGGSATINGTISADGLNTRTSSAANYTRGAGGSIWLRAATVSGSGLLSASAYRSGTAGYYGSGGGRIAVEATAGADLGNLILQAFPDTQTRNGGGRAGTVYRATTAFRELVINQNNIGTDSANVTPLPASDDIPAHPAVTGELANATLILTNQARAGLTSSLRAGDLAWLGGKLSLGTYTLFVGAEEPAGLFPADYGNGTVETGAQGRLLWGNAPATFRVDIQTGSGGSVLRDPAAAGDYFLAGTSTVLTAQPDPGKRVWWRGDVPGAPGREAQTLVVDREGLSVRAVFVEADPALAPLRTWTGAGANALAGTAANWSPEGAPADGDRVLFDGTSSSNCSWDRDVVLTGWEQTAGYTGVVTIQTKFPDYGAFKRLEVTGPIAVNGGVWTHPANSGGQAAADRLAVLTADSFALGTGAVVNLNGRGYAASSGPGAGVAAARGGRSGSHGGMGAYTAAYEPAPCYGEPHAPTLPGSGGSYAGGGVFNLEALGAAAIDGLVTADGVNLSPNDADVRSGAAGGSIWIRAGAVSGTGTAQARGSHGYSGGAGGRVALEATNAAAVPGPVAVASASPTYKVIRSTAGTVYLKSTAFERLIVDASNYVSQAGVATELPPAYNTYAVQPAVGGPLEDATLFLTNRAVVRLANSIRLGDFAWHSATSSLDLNGFTLFLKAPEPPGPFPQDYGRGTILTNEGRILWGDAAVQFPVVVATGPNGVAGLSPYHTNDLYDLGSEVVLSATGSPGHVFLYWKGDLPAGAARTDNPLTVPVDQRRELKAFFASSAAGVRTWTGDGVTELASNPQNWHPVGAPEAGEHVLFNGTSLKACTWDVDVELGSWTQREDYQASWSPLLGYAGWVFFGTKYPLFGAFTNLTIAGDCTLLGGTWTHPNNTGNTTESERIWVTVGGDFALGANAKVDLSSFGGQSESRGYAPLRGPGADSSARNLLTGRGASHGGRGAAGSNIVVAACYGSFREPIHLGSGAFNYGGGAIRLEVGGHAQVDGTIDARGGPGRGPEQGCAGGSILLRAGTAGGGGLLTATGAQGLFSGGGGRVAAIVTNGSDFGDVRMQAFAGVWGDANRRGAAGTVYTRALGQNRLVVDNNNLIQAEAFQVQPWATELPAAIGGDDPAAFEELVLVVTNRGRVVVTVPDLRIRDLQLATNCVLHLEGRTLYVRSPFPKTPLPGTVVADGGRIAWLSAGTVILLR